MRYQPGFVPDGGTIKAWLSDELRRISNALGPAEYLRVAPIDVEPDRPAQGMIVYAQAITWNPGAGAGLYVFDGATWVKVS
jgi:hypothetical protein